MLDSHADSVDKNRDHDAPAEVFALHDAPEFPPHTVPNVPQVSEAGPLPPLYPYILLLPALLLVHFLHCILLLVLPTEAAPLCPGPFRLCTYRAVVGALRHGQADGVGRRLGAVVRPALMWAVGRYRDAETSDKPSSQTLTSSLELHLFKSNMF